MGFWGTLVVARSATPLPELIADQVQRAESAGEYADGWQVARIFGDVNPGDLADELRARTGSPVIAGIVFDSDCVDLRVNGSSCWTTTLCREAAASYFRTYLHEAKGLHGAELEAETTSMLGETPQEAAALFVEWAAIAGRQVLVEPLLETLEADAAPFAEDCFYELLERLGLKEPTE